MRDIAKVLIQSLLSITVLFALSRLTGRRSIHQLTTFDYINSITIGNMAAELATDLENWTEPLTAMLVFALLTAGVNWATCKSLRFRRILNGRPLLLYENDRILKDNLLHAKMDINEFLTQCRLAGYFDLGQIETAILETNGQVSFLPKSDQRPVTPQDLSLAPEKETLYISLILDGHVLPENLCAAGKDLRWLREQLHAAGIGQISEVFYACCDEGGRFRACREPGSRSDRSLFEQ
jgi:uncharacterized membrane protein YcaP (DUF421 family)